MKRLIVVLLALVTCCSAQVITGVRHRKVVAGGGGSPSATSTYTPLVSTCTTGSPCAVTLTSATLSGDALVCYVTEDTNLSTGSVCTASGAVFSAPASCDQTVNSEARITVLVAPNVPSGITTVNVGGAGLSPLQVAVFAVHNVQASPVDVCNVSDVTAVGTPFHTASITTVNANDFIVAVANEFFVGAPETYTWSAPCVVAGTQGSQISGGTKTLTGTATTDCAVTTSNTSGHQLTATIGLKY